MSEVVRQMASQFRDQLGTWLDGKGLPDWSTGAVTIGIFLVALLVIGWVTFAILRPLVLRGAKSLAKRTATTIDDRLFGFGVFRWLTHVAPAIVFHELAPAFYVTEAPWLGGLLMAVSRLYLIVAIFLVFDSLIDAGRAVYRESELSRKFPIEAIVQVVKLVAFLVALLLGISVLVDQPPLVLLGGLGVFASVLMLVFKDPILGFVAGIQLTSNEMVLPGDWVEMPARGADGDVIEVGLTTVKVRNWDKTITMVPTYAMISESFRNWRGMTESGGRRIKRSLFVDVSSIRFCDPPTLERFSKIEYIAEYLAEKEREIAAWNREHGIDEEATEVNGRRLTNVGTFRAYVEAYLQNHPRIRKDMTLLVRQLSPGDRGLPIEIYCFTSTTAWLEYESIQADIFDHLLAAAREFDLRIFQSPSGLDVREAMAGRESGG